MVIIFGWGSGEAQDFGEVAPIVCPNCHNEVFLHHIKSNKQVSLFFVPLASYGNNEFLACPICRHGIEVGPGHKRAIDQIRAATKLHRSGQLRDDFYWPQVEQFWARVGVTPSGQPVAGPAAGAASQGGLAAASAATAEPQASIRTQLEGYAKLHADGVLSDEEFAAIKRRLLGI